MSDAVTREEALLNAIATGEAVDIVPVTRKEKYLRYLAGIGEKPSKPITREEMFLDKILAGGGGGITPTGDINITENGEFDVTEFAKAIVNVAGGDSGGAKMATGTLTFENQVRISLYDDNVRVTHNLGVIPKGLLLWVTTRPSSLSSGMHMLITEVISESMRVYSTYQSSKIYHTDQTNDDSALEMINNANATETEIDIFFSHRYRSDAYIPAGATMRWLVWG